MVNYKRGINKVQSSCIFHTLDEARGYQNLNGGTLNISTGESEITNVEIVESCPSMHEIQWRTRRTHDERETCRYANNAIDAKL